MLKTLVPALILGLATIVSCVALWLLEAAAPQEITSTKSGVVALGFCAVMFGVWVSLGFTRQAVGVWTTIASRTEARVDHSPAVGAAGADGQEEFRLKPRIEHVAYHERLTGVPASGPVTLERLSDDPESAVAIARLRQELTGLPS